MWPSRLHREKQSTLHALDFDAVATLNPQTLRRDKTRRGEPLSTWARYPAGVAWALLATGGQFAAWTPCSPRKSLAERG